MADDFDGEHDDHANGLGHTGRNHEVFDVGVESLRHDPLQVVVHPGGQRAADGDVDVARRRHQAGNQAHVIADQDEHSERRDQWQELRREPLLVELKQRLRDVRQGPDGFLYVLTAEDDGALLRIEPR